MGRRSARGESTEVTGGMGGYGDLERTLRRGVDSGPGTVLGPDLPMVPFAGSGLRQLGKDLTNDAGSHATRRTDHVGMSGELVETAAGTVRGTSERGVWAFKGIPYGADTSRHRPFPPALPPNPWPRPRECPYTTSS